MKKLLMSLIFISFIFLFDGLNLVWAQATAPHYPILECRKDMQLGVWYVQNYDRDFRIGGEFLTRETCMFSVNRATFEVCLREAKGTWRVFRAFDGEPLSERLFERRDCWDQKDTI